MNSVLILKLVGAWLAILFTSYVSNAYGSNERSNTKVINYTNFTLYMDCSKKSAYMFEYKLSKDIANFKRKHSFFLDKNYSSCQQHSTNTYKNTFSDERYDRGHLVPANHMDNSELAIKESNYMTNITPQVANMNRGAWLLTEEITECYRDIADVQVIGGALWQERDTSNKKGAWMYLEPKYYFVKTHGIITPTHFWKVLIQGNKATAWIIPNSSEATKKMLDKYVVSKTTLTEQLQQAKITIKYNLDGLSFTNSSWHIPKGCDKS
jgi:endonuclease G, mitochondrial